MLDNDHQQSPLHICTVVVGCMIICKDAISISVSTIGGYFFL